MNKKVLVVEDDPFLTKMYVVGLKHEGFFVAHAYDGEEGLERAEHETPDIILLDLMLPKMSGFEVLAALKKNPVTQRIPVLILSNLSQESDKKKATELGAEGFLEKNKFTVSQIAQLVGERLRVGQEEKEAVSV